MDGQCLMSGNNGVPCGQHTAFGHQTIVGCSWELGASGERSLDSSGPALSKHQSVSIAGNFFGARLVIEPQHPIALRGLPH